METFALAVAQIREQTSVLTGMYFVAFASGSMDRATFVGSQLEFMHAVDAFPSALGRLAERSKGAARAALLANLADERGEREGSSGPSHGETFRELLVRLGVTERQLAEHRPGAAVGAFNLLLARASDEREPSMALAMFGMIEDLFADVSGFLGEHMVRRGLLEQTDVVHYATHETLDREHSAALYAPLGPLWAIAEERQAVMSGLMLGAACLTALYAGLFEIASAGPKP